MDFNLNQIALIVVLFVIGLLLGGMMSGRGKYKRLWRDEQAAHRTMVKDRDARLSAANERIAELERQRNDGPIGVGTGAAVAGAVHGRDELTQIRGVTSQEEIVLNEAGYHRFGQIARMSDEQQATLEGRLGLRPGTITRDEWREQARALDSGRSGEQARRI
ncbi:MAG: hypothetical protein ABW164_04190 [Sphingobium sp.]